ncbi:MAG: PAS domain S-box protein [Gammaproteobacteria bacterium]
MAAGEHPELHAPLIDAMTDAAALFGIDFALRKANRAFVELWSPADPARARALASAPAVLQPVLERAACGTTVRECLRVDGADRMIDLCASPVRGAGAAVTAVLVTCRDAGAPLREQGPARSAVEQALVESEARFRQMVDSSPIPLVITRESDGVLLYANPRAREIDGIVAQADDAQSAGGFVVGPVQRRRWVEQLVRDGRVHGVEVAVRNTDGSEHWLVLTSVHTSFGGESALMTQCVDITERKRAESALVQSESRFREMVSRSPIPMAITRESDGAFLFANPAAAEYIGFEQDALQKGTSRSFYADPHLRGQWLRAMQGRDRASGVEIELRDAHGESRWVSLNVARLPFEGEQALLVEAVDITAHRRAEAELARYRDQLEELVRQRTDELAAANRELEAFVYSVSHDLRAPLRGIDGYSMVLLEESAGRLDEQSCEYLRRIRRAAQRLGQMIDDLLRFSRSAREDMQVGEVDISRIAREVTEEFERIHPGRAVDTRIAPDLVASGDARLLRIVMENLLSNAWKFSATRPVAEIEVGARTVDGQTAFYVRDNGVGFDKTHAYKLFLPFQRLHLVSEFEGTGIGLASTLRILRRHGGNAWGESDGGRGATFWFTLPGARGGQAPDAGPAASVA